MPRSAVYAKGIAKREQILASALEVIATKGYRGASVREIADAAGLSPAGLLHYFDSKEELFTAILRARDERDGREYGSADAIETFLSVVRHNATVPGLVQLYAQLAVEAADHDHPARKYFLDRTEQIEQVSAESVAQAQRDGWIRSDLDPAWIVRTLHALADGLQPLWLLYPDLDMAAHIEQFITLLKPAPLAPQHPAPESGTGRSTPTRAR